MPTYEIHHSYPLKHEEQQALAESITKLHATTFTVPSFFIHVRFVPHDATDHRYYVAGKPRTTATNRIIAHVRTSSSRSKSDFDLLAQKLEEAWKDAIYGPIIEPGQKNEGKRPKEVDETERDAVARKLLSVAFIPLVTTRKGGVTIPEAGKEADWFKENMEYFEKVVEEKGDEDFEEMLKEWNEREDLKEKLEGGGVAEQLSAVMQKIGISSAENKEASGGDKKDASTGGQEK